MNPPKHFFSGVKQWMSWVSYHIHFRVQGCFPCRQGLGFVAFKEARGRGWSGFYRTSSLEEIAT